MGYSLDLLKQIAHGLAQQFGDSCEIVIHDVRHGIENTILKSKDDVLTLFVHLGYLAYDKKTREVFIPNKETLEICKRNSLYTKTVVQAIS